MSPFQVLSPETAPLLPSPGGNIVPSPADPFMPTIPAFPSPPNPDNLVTPASDSAFSPFGLVSGSSAANQRAFGALSFAIVAGLTAAYCTMHLLRL